MLANIHHSWVLWSRIPGSELENFFLHLKHFWPETHKAELKGSQSKILLSSALGWWLKPRTTVTMGNTEVTCWNQNKSLYPLEKGIWTPEGPSCLISIHFHLLFSTQFLQVLGSYFRYSTNKRILKMEKGKLIDYDRWRRGGEVCLCSLDRNEVWCRCVENLRQS